jgi:myo-inositol-1(or 4)-monophosphatase
MEVPPQTLIETAERAARRGGDVLQEWSTKFTTREKSRKNLVTEADVNSQAAIVETIRDSFPDHGFLGEEDLAIAGGQSEYRWIIDPLDGTTNYVHGFPYYAVSIGIECRGRLVAGVIFDPTRNEMFTAIDGSGAFLNGRSLRPSETEVLSEAFCVASLPVGARGDEPQVQQFLRVLPAARTVQRTGSAALNLCYVACGRIDAYWSGSLKPWDQAGGALIVQEAGGQVTRMNGSPFDVELPDLLATNGRSLHIELQSLLTD